ncbi:MAG: hypothetical protein IJ156_01320, partial [Bacteroidales bacterium]|nr:hypothetical protein [Bacteroidales bacterium]
MKRLLLVVPILLALAGCDSDPLRREPLVPVTPQESTEWEDAATAVRNMGAGWNLGNSLDANSGDLDNMWIEAYSDRKPATYETAWGQPVTTRALFHMF